MKRWLLALALAAGTYWAPAAQAQFVSPFRPAMPLRPPTVSPYLNLNRGGLAGINYFNLVRPQIDTQRGLQTLGQQVQDLNSGVTPDGTPVGGSPVPNYMFYPNFPAMPAGGIHPLTRRR